MQQISNALSSAGTTAENLGSSLISPFTGGGSAGTGGGVSPAVSPTQAAAALNATNPATATGGGGTPYTGNMIDPSSLSSGGGAGGGPAKNFLSLAGIIGSVIQGIQRSQMQSNLQNPDYIAKQIGTLESKEAPALLRALGPGIQAQQASMGLSTAPGLMEAAEFAGIAPELIGDAQSQFFSGEQAAQGYDNPGFGEFNIGNLINQLYGTGATP